MNRLDGFLGREDQKRPVSINIHVRDNGFDVVIQVEIPVTVKVDWTDVKRIEAHRSEEDDRPSASLTFVLFWGRPKITLERGDIGFEHLPPALSQAFPGIPANWEAEVEAPYGFPVHRILYEAD